MYTIYSYMYIFCSLSIVRTVCHISQPKYTTNCSLHMLCCTTLYTDFTILIVYCIVHTCTWHLLTYIHSLYTTYITKRHTLYYRLYYAPYIYIIHSLYTINHTLQHLYLIYTKDGEGPV